MKVTAVTSIALGLALAFSAAIAQGVRRVDIDILPNRKENEIKLADKDKSIQVVILGETNFSVSQIEAGTVEMAGAKPVAMNGRRVNTNMDSDSDIEYRFQIGKMTIADTTTSLCVTGKLLDGQLFRGCGDVIVKP